MRGQKGQVEVQVKVPGTERLSRFVVPGTNVSLRFSPAAPKDTVDNRPRFTYNLSQTLPGSSMVVAIGC